MHQVARSRSRGFGNVHKQQQTVVHSSEVECQRLIWKQFATRMVDSARAASLRIARWASGWQRHDQAWQCSSARCFCHSQMSVLRVRCSGVALLHPSIACCQAGCCCYGIINDVPSGGVIKNEWKLTAASKKTLSKGHSNHPWNDVADRLAGDAPRGRGWRFKSTPSTVCRERVQGRHRRACFL